MRGYDYNEKWKKLLTPEIVMMLTQIHELKGEQALFIESKPDSLNHLLEIAKIQSTEASNKIEGINTSIERLKKIVMDKTMPRSRDEEEIAGYRDVLATIHESHDFIPVKTNMILQLHRDLYKFSGKTAGGSYKISDNIISEKDEQGNEFVRFEPLPAWETPDAMERLCNAYTRVIGKREADPLLIIPMFILDFLSIHPFDDGNGRMSRLLTLLLLYRSGYIVGKYISIERLTEQTKQTYYETLYESSQGWHGEENDYIPFVRYMLGLILSAYREFSSRVNLLTTRGISKPDRVAEIIKETYGKLTKKEIMAKCPDISEVTVQRTLIDLQNKERIIKIGGGRYTAYIWNREKE